MKVVVVGGGPAGLVTLKFLATAHEYYPDLKAVDVQLFEAEDDIGGTFKYRVWDKSELVSSKFLTPFSDFRISKDAPDFLSPEDYVEYLRDYAEHFGVLDRVRCSSVVSSVRRNDDAGQGHVVTVFCRKTGSFVQHHCDAVVVCSGLNLTPNIPSDIEGLIANDDGSQAAATPDWVTASGGNGQLNPDESWMNRVFSARSPPFPHHSFRLIHSSTFKNSSGDSSEFLSSAGEPSTVVVLGAGETAHDIAALAVNNPGVGRVIMCHRDGFFVAPKVVPEPVILGLFGRPYPGMRPNKPIDTTVASLFDTAYVPPALQRSNLIWDLYNLWVKWMFGAISGTSGGYDQWVGAVSSGRRHVDSYFVVKTTKAIPYISAPYRSQAGIWNSIRSFFINIPLQDTHGREIELAPWPTRVWKRDDANDGAPHKEIMEFRDNGSPESDRLKRKTDKVGPVRPDVVIFATGYRREFPFMSDEYPKLQDCKVRGVYEKIEDGVAYIGFVRPSIGAIPPLAELQAQLWISRFVEHHLGKTNGKLDAPRHIRATHNAVKAYELDYALHPRGGYDFFKQKLGVDHESYALQLALDMGSAPKATHVLCKHGWKVFFAWAMGPNFNTKFRLVGPWAAPEQAAELMRTELFDVVKRTGGGVFFVTYTVVPQVIFGFLSMAVMLGEWMVRAVGALLQLGSSSVSM